VGDRDKDFGENKVDARPLMIRSHCQIVFKC
jgi:hypothetical protein